MFDNIGKKIKSLAKILCWVGIIAYVIAAIIMIAIGMDEYEEELTAFGVILLFVGPLMSWISSFFMYGFGELIDKACDIERNTRSGEIKSEAQVKADYERVNKIEKLRSEGLITEEEYQQAISKEND